LNIGGDTTKLAISHDGMCDACAARSAHPSSGLDDAGRAMIVVLPEQLRQRFDSQDRFYGVLPQPRRRQ
jgi:hypothetical protein